MERGLRGCDVEECTAVVRARYAFAKIVVLRFAGGGCIAKVVAGKFPVNLIEIVGD